MNYYKLLLKTILLIVITLSSVFSQSKIFIFMDLKQTDHLKAYGVTFHALTKGLKADWLLNYRGGSFIIDYSDDIAVECRVEGVAFETITAISSG